MVEILIRFKAILPHQVLHVKCFGRLKYSTWKHMKTERPLKGHMFHNFAETKGSNPYQKNTNQQ